MNKIQRFLLLAVATAFSFIVQAQDQNAQKRWEEYMTTGPFHDMLAKDNGTWKADVKIWPAPGAPEMNSTGKAEFSMLLGGRYQQMIFTGDMMGMPFEGHSIIGYDNAKKKVFTTWIDNMGTGLIYMDGNWDEGAKTFTLSGRQYDPGSGKDIDVRQTIKYLDNNTQVTESFTNVDGKDFKMMEITLKRE